MNITLAGPIDTQMLRRLSGRGIPGAPNGQGGAPVSDLAAGLLRAGHRVNIATLDASIEVPQTFVDEDLTITYVPWRAPPRYRTRTRMLDLFEQEIRGLERAIRAFDGEFVHGHWSYEYGEAAIRSKLPHLITLHDLGWDYFWIMRDAYRFMRLIMKYRVMLRARHISVVGPFMQKKLWQYGYFGRSVAIPNGIILPERSNVDLATRLGGPLRFVTIGNAGNIKNVRASVLAFRTIRARYPQAELHLFGPGLGPDFAAGEPNVIGHGNVSHGDLMTFLREQATVLVHPSRIEACPVIIAEAKAMSVPVVGGWRSGGVPFVCSEDAGCLLVDIEDPAAIAEAALTIVADPTVYRSMAEKARLDTETRFASDVVTARYLAVYDDILSGRWA